MDSFEAIKVILQVGLFRNQGQNYCVSNLKFRPDKPDLSVNNFENKKGFLTLLSLKGLILGDAH